MPRRPAITIVLLLCVTACTTFRVEQELTPEQVIATRHPQRVKVTRTDSSSVVFRLPRVMDGRMSGVSGETQFSIPLSDIRQIATPVFSPGHTFALVAVVAGGFLALFALTWGTW